MSRTTVRYSEAFKLNVVEELRQGRFGSPHEAGLAHGIGRGTVSRWLRQYGSEELLAKVVRHAATALGGHTRNSMASEA